MPAYIPITAFFAVLSILFDGGMFLTLFIFPILPLLIAAVNRYAVNAFFMILLILGMTKAIAKD